MELLLKTNHIVEAILEEIKEITGLSFIEFTEIEIYNLIKEIKEGGK